MNTSDSSLLASTVVGDADAFATSYRRQVGAVTGFAVRLGATSDDVADIMSETFSLALARADRCVPMSDSARPWLLGIAWRVAQHGYRRRARQFRLRLELVVHAGLSPAQVAAALGISANAARLRLARARRRMRASASTNDPFSTIEVKETPA